MERRNSSNRVFEANESGPLLVYEDNVLVSTLQLAFTPASLRPGSPLGPRLGATDGSEVPTNLSNSQYSECGHWA
ncbi:hypothetical protein BDY24DRAFT_416181 [Mrakia frigida]|uniref:uncharacterized protein n=1 Tax=Mrakia frigida TaxID=29902 RepID=UPI003FCC2342